MSTFKNLIIHTGILILISSATFIGPEKLFPVNQLGVRNAHCMAATADGSIYLFGGADEKKVLNDLWILRDDKWLMINTGTKKPMARTFANMVYHPGLKGLFLFGGNQVLFGSKLDSLNLLNDSWLFHKGKWREINSKSKPCPRTEAAMVWSPEDNGMLLFGGYTILSGKIEKLNDTWLFTNNEWVKLSIEGPAPRTSPSMAFDNTTRQIILFGGSCRPGCYGANKGETWIWSKQKWILSSEPQPENLYNSSIAASGNTVLRFGGWNGQTRNNELWQWVSNKWGQLISTANPPSRNHSGMVYDSKKDRFILFGGHDGRYVFGDTWEYKNGGWKELSKTKLRERINNNH